MKFRKLRSTHPNRVRAYDVLAKVIEVIPTMTDDHIADNITALNHFTYVRGNKSREQMVLTYVRLLARKIIDA